MSLWLVRTGKMGEYEKRFLEEERIYLTWDRLSHDLSKVKSKRALYDLLLKLYPDVKQGAVRNWTGQVWPFAHEMKEGDWVVIPSKLKRAAIHFAEITGPYVYDRDAEKPFYHCRTVKLIATDIPRSNFDQDLLFSFGALQTVCRIKRGDAERRIHAMAKAGWKGEFKNNISVEDEILDEEVENLDLERSARDQISKLILQKFKGHGLARLVEAILIAQGYTTYLSPEGPDKGIDILAAPGPLGFGNPRICVQVKSGDTPVDSPTLSQLIGSMQKVQAGQGLLVSWSGFKSSIDRERATEFFRVRLWDQEDLIDALLTDYDKLDADLRADLPLKRIWTLAELENEA
jgi:restriction system protein